MPITLPNLDDRRYADLMEEARSLLVAHAPALTNHNPSDPVITLAELFAYFTEVLLFRVNNVTDAHRVKFLRLLNGPGWSVPASRAELDAEVRRTIVELRRPDRAVTAADFEFLARAADRDGRIARAHCIPERNLAVSDPAQRLQPQPSHVSVVIVPLVPGDLGTVQPIVTNYLEERRLLTARVHVVGPRFVPVRVRVTVRLLPDALDTQVRPRIIAALTNFFAPVGGPSGGGWPLGRNANVSEIYRLLDTLPGVDFARRTFGPSNELDELATTSAFADRLLRNEAGDLIGIALDPDELVGYQIPTRGSETENDLVIELPPITV